MCLPWAITNWVWEFYSFKNALGAQSLSQRPRHGLGTDGKIFLKLYDFLNILTRSIWKKRGGTERPWSSNTIIHTLWRSFAVVFGDMRFLVFCFTFSKMFSFNAGATRVDFSIHPHGHPRYTREKIGILFSLFQAQKKKRAFRIDVCNMCLPWAITNWVWEFYSFKNALGAQSLSQRPRHGLGTDGKIFLKFYEFFYILTRSIWKKNGNQKTMITQHNLTEETKKTFRDVRRSSSISSIANFATFRHSDHSAMIRSTDFFRHYHQLIVSKFLSCALRLPSCKNNQ